MFLILTLAGIVVFLAILYIWIMAFEIEGIDIYKDIKEDSTEDSPPVNGYDTSNDADIISGIEFNVTPKDNGEVDIVERTESRARHKRRVFVSTILKSK